MSWLASCILALFHAVYYVINIVRSFRASRARPPNPLAAKRKQVPTHLALLLATDNDTVSVKSEDKLLENILQVVSWCRTAGIPRLTVYDRDGEFKAMIVALLSAHTHIFVYRSP